MTPAKGSTAPRGGPCNLGVTWTRKKSSAKDESFRAGIEQLRKEKASLLGTEPGPRGRMGGMMEKMQRKALPGVKRLMGPII